MKEIQIVMGPSSCLSCGIGFETEALADLHFSTVHAPARPITVTVVVLQPESKKGKN